MIYTFEDFQGLNLFQMNHMMSKKHNECKKKKKKQISLHFLLLKESYAAKCSKQYETCNLYKTFQVFAQRSVNTLTDRCFVTVKINLDIISTEIIFYYGVY